MSNETTVLLELCQRATNLANTNSTRTVEYLAAAKNHQTPGFRDLAINFLEVLQTLWPLQAGLMDQTRGTGLLPVEIAKELTSKVQQTIDDFNSLDLLLTRLLAYERKKGFSKFTKGLSLMNIDGEVHKLSGSLAKDRDTLRMGSLAFKWVLGDANLPSSMSSAYTSLLTTLRAGKGMKPASLQSSQHIPISSSLSVQPPASIPSVSQRESARNDSPPAKLPPLPTWRDSELLTLEPVVYEQPSKPLPNFHSSTTIPATNYSTNFPLRLKDSDAQNTVSRFGASTPSTQRQPMSPYSDVRATGTSPNHEVDDMSIEWRRTTMSDTASQTTVESVLHLEDMLKSYEYDRKNTVKKQQVTSTTSGPRTPATSQFMPLPSPRPHQGRRIQRGPPDSVPATVKNAICTAIQQKNHTVVEELLESSMSLETIVELDLVYLAISIADSGSLRLLLLSGAEPNRPCLDGGLPLQVSTQMALFDISSILLKYGADSGLTTPANQESSILLAVNTNQVELLELFDRHTEIDFNSFLDDGETLFIRAIASSASLAMIDLMLERGADPNKKTKHGKTPLLEAIFSKRVDVATALLDAGANPNLAGPKHPLWPATHAATHDTGLLQLLLARGSRPNMAPGIMELATSINSIEAVKVLLEAKVDPNIKKDGVYTPLCSAIRDDRADIVTLLLQHKADPNVPASEYPAFKCVSHKRLHFLPDLILAGADLNTPTGILEVAVAHKNKEALLFLLDEGVDANARDSEGHTALTTAIRDNQVDLVDVLLEKGASPAIRGSGKNWPLTLALQNPTVLSKILRVLPKNHHGGTKGIIEAAVVANQLESVKLLVAAGFSVEDKTGGVFSPLTSALRERHLDIVQYLLDEAGADINAAGEHLPIVKALRRCRGSHDTEAIKMLLERGTDINQVYRGWSGIMQAIEIGDVDILNLMTSKAMMAVDLKREYEEGQTLVDFIQERDWEEGAKMLLSSAA